MPALERSTNGALALHYAAARGCLDCVKLLIETSSDISSNTQMDNDVTPVYLAAQEGHLEVLKFLVLEAGGSLYVRAKDGMAPVHAAAQMGCLTCLKWMIQDQGVDTNLKDGDGATPLHFASSRGHVETVRWLLRHGARLTLDKYGKSPINDAAENQQMECLNILVQHGTTPDYPDERLANGKFHGCTCRKGDPQERCSYPDCVNYSSPREPFFLHPRPESPPSPGHDGLYINPMNHNNDNSSVSSNGSESFFLHNPNELVYTRVKDLFDGSNRKHCSENPPCNTLTGLTVKVEVHSSSSGAGSEENLSSSDLSDRSAEQDHDYEDIYHIREGNRTNRNNTKCGRSRSRDSGSHSRSGSISSTNSGGIIMKLAPHPVEKDGQDEPSMTPSTESGVSSASPSDLGGSEEENDKSKVSHCRTLPYQNNFNSRQLKRVVSEPGSIYPPPPPPLPPTDPVEHSQLSRRSSCNTSRDDEDGILKPSDLRRDNVAGGKSSDVGDDGEGVTGVHVNKHMVLPFIPPKFTSNGDDCLIKPSEYLKSIGSRVVAPSAKVVDKSEVEKSDVKVIGSETCPPPPPLPERQEAADETKVKKIQQPLSSISIHDINSVQLRRTEKTAVNKTMSAPQKSFNTTPQEPFQAQKQDLIAELKMSRDIEGVKKMKVERAKSEEKQEKELVTEIAKQLTANTMLEQIPEKDGAGNPIPPWKRQMMAKKAAEKARKELEEQLQKEAEEKRLQAIPAWKRQLLAKKEENDSKIQIYTPKIADEKKTPPVLLKVNNPEINPAMMDNSAEENDKENNRPNKESEEEGDEEEPVHIIPWRAQLRKTNSKLNLLD